MGKGSGVLSGILLSSLVFSGCVTKMAPVRSPLPVGPPPVPAPPKPVPQKKTEMPIKKPESVKSPLAPSPIFSCQTLAGSKNRVRTDFVMEGQATLPKEQPLLTALEQAKKNAVDRVFQCSGVARMMSGIYDRTHPFVRLDKVNIEREIRASLRIRTQYRTEKVSCQDEGDHRFCHVVLSGRIETVRPDSSFRIRTFGLGKSGVYQEGQEMHVRFSLSQPANVYLFSVDESGGGTLLYPVSFSEEIDNPLPPGKPIVFPPEGRIGVRLVPALVKARDKSPVRHLWIIALKGKKLLSTQDIGKMRTDQGDLPHVRNFRKTILKRFRKAVREGDWGLKVIPYQIVKKTEKLAKSKPSGKK